MFSWRSYRFWRNLAIATIPLILALWAGSCSSPKEEIGGVVTFRGNPVKGATVSAYIEGGDFEKGDPFMKTETGEGGMFHLKTGRGSFYLVARKTEQFEGRNRVIRGRPAREPLLAGDGSQVKINLSPIEKEGFIPHAGTFIKGKVVNSFGDVKGTYVYAYRVKRHLSTGPTFLTRKAVGDDGSFTLPMKQGSYTIVAMKREGRDSGPLTEEDLRAEYGGNPIFIRDGQVVKLGTLKLKKPDAGKLKEMWAGGDISTSKYIISGRVVDEENSPVSRIYVMAYRDSRMMGRPDSVSRATDEQGRFVIVLPGPGKYYVGARESLGGPLSPGEVTGRYDGSPDHSIAIKRDQKKKDISIKVRETY